MPMPAGSGDRPCVPQQQVLLENQRRWVASMVAKGHKSSGWFGAKERALSLHQQQRLSAVVGAQQPDRQPPAPVTVREAAPQPQTAADYFAANAVAPAPAPVLDAELLEVLKQHRLGMWSRQLERAGITTLPDLLGMTSDAALPQNMPAASKRALMNTVQKLTAASEGGSSGYADPMPPPPRRPSDPSLRQSIPHHPYSGYAPPSDASGAHLSVPGGYHPSPAASPTTSPSIAPQTSPYLHAHAGAGAYAQDAPQRHPSVRYPHPSEAQPQRLGSVATLAGDAGVPIDDQPLRRPEVAGGEDAFNNLTSKPGVMDDAQPKAGDFDLVECGVNCNRKFRVDRIDRHRIACAKTKEPRKVFVPKRVAAEAEAAQQQAPPMVEKRESKWRQNHNHFQAVVKGQPIAEPVDDRIPCPHCQRKFAPLVAENHIPNCKERSRRQPASQQPHPHRRGTNSPPRRSSSRQPPRPGGR
eukprot:TRINITY_DN15789_c0_g1_i1.p1 TRINITY_DN15789_c0_g1~~TRINITY_DN15789_c0_g1_i1.p1  ORF type:complete len:469 (+),score=155.88 TRINITY_DN15789_c0_g1_i1:66-1472(+)